jgi:hypothetical protein
MVFFELRLLALLTNVYVVDVGRLTILVPRKIVFIFGFKNTVLLSPSYDLLSRILLVILTII